MGGTGKASKKKEDEEEPDSPEKKMSRKQVVGYGYQDTHTAREQLWGKYKAKGMTDMHFGGGDRTVKRISRISKQKDGCLLFKALCPPLDWLTTYRLGQLFPDVLSGLIVGAAAVPLSFAHALIADVSPRMGLWTCLVPTLTYALLGSSRHCSQGTDATMALLTHGITSQYDDVDKNAIAQILALQVGIVLFLFGIFRVDYVIHYISRPILSGFISGATILVIMSQCKYLIGIDYSSSRFGFVNVYRFFDHIDEGRWVTVIASSIMLPILLICTIVKSKMMAKMPRKPSLGRRICLALLTMAPLFVVTAATFASWILYENTDDTAYHLNVIGNPKIEFPTPGIDSVAPDTSTLISDILPQAVVIALVSYISSMSMALSYSCGDYEVSGIQELLSHGAASILGSVFGAMPPSTGLSRTALASSSGQQTQIASLVSFGVMVFVLIAMDNAFNYMPYCALACIVSVSSAALFDYKTPLWLWRIKAKEDLATWVFALIATIGLGVTFGLGASVGLSLVLIIGRISLPKMAVLGRAGEDFEPIHKSELIQGVAVVNVNSNLFFGNSGRFKEQLLGMMSDANEIEIPLFVFVLDLTSVTAIDATGLTTLQEINSLFLSHGSVLMFAGLNPQVYMFMRSSGIQHEMEQKLYLGIDLDTVVEAATKEADSKFAELDVGSPLHGGNTKLHTNAAKANTKESKTKDTKTKDSEPSVSVGLEASADGGAAEADIQLEIKVDDKDNEERA